MRCRSLVVVLALLGALLGGCGPGARVEDDAFSVGADSPEQAADSPEPTTADSPDPASDAPIPGVDGAYGPESTVYDPVQHVYWLADANLAGDPGMRAAMGVSGINDDGTMSYATALAWVAALNAYDGGAGYLGHTDWQLPTNPIFLQFLNEFRDVNRIKAFLLFLFYHVEVADAIVGNSLNQVSFRVSDLVCINGEPLQKCLLHDVFRICFAAYDAVRNRSKRGLVKCDGLCPVHSCKSTGKSRFHN